MGSDTAFSPPFMYAILTLTTSWDKVSDQATNSPSTFARVLPACREDLKAHLQAVDPLPVNLRDLLGCMPCPSLSCRRPLSHGDLQHLLPADTLEKASLPSCCLGIPCELLCAPWNLFGRTKTTPGKYPLLSSHVRSWTEAYAQRRCGKEHCRHDEIVHTCKNVPPCPLPAPSAWTTLRCPLQLPSSQRSCEPCPQHCGESSHHLFPKA